MHRVAAFLSPTQSCRLVAATVKSVRTLMRDERSTKDERGRRNVCHAIEVQRATKPVPTTVTSRSSHCHSTCRKAIGDNENGARERCEAS